MSARKPSQQGLNQQKFSDPSSQSNDDRSSSSHQVMQKTHVKGQPGSQSYSSKGLYDGSIMPRKRARESDQSSGAKNHKLKRRRIEDSDSDQENDEATSSEEEDTRTVEAFRDEDTDLRMSSSKKTGAGSQEERKRAGKNLKQDQELEDEDDSEGDDDDDNGVYQGQDSTASQIPLKDKGSKASVKEKVGKETAVKKLNFNSYISQLIQQEREANDELSQQSRRASALEMVEIFKKKQHLIIEALQNRATPHLLKNKTSDKFMRRDIQFYDLYVKKESGEELSRLKDGQFPLEIDAEQYYNDLEVDDYNQLFWNHMLIQEKFGRSIKVSLDVKPGQGLMMRNVVEHPHLVRISDLSELSPQKYSPDGKRRNRDENEQQKDPDLIQLDKQLKQLESQFGKTSEEIAEIFCKVSGRLDKMKDYLENKPVVEWTYLDDLALTKPDNSPEFLVLLQTKGLDEIKIRREFLQVTPIIGGDDDENNTAKAQEKGPSAGQPLEAPATKRV